MAWGGRYRLYTSDPDLITGDLRHGILLGVVSVIAFATKTPVLLVTVGIVKVTFADGSTWSDDEAQQRNTWDNNFHKKHDGCEVHTASKRS